VVCLSVLPPSGGGALEEDLRPCDLDLTIEAPCWHLVGSECNPSRHFAGFVWTYHCGPDTAPTAAGHVLIGLHLDLRSLSGPIVPMTSEQTQAFSEWLMFTRWPRRENVCPLSTPRMPEQKVGVVGRPA
jgi:hypothetical protein